MGFLWVLFFIFFWGGVCCVCVGFLGEGATAKSNLLPTKRHKSTSKTTPPAADRVTGHARGCARERTCPKLEGMWTRK